MKAFLYIIKNILITIPAAEDCYNCHSQDVHEVHQAVMGEICVGCHGKAINKFPELKEGKAAVLKTPKEKPKAFSLYDLLKFLFPLIFGYNTKRMSLSKDSSSSPS